MRGEVVDMNGTMSGGGNKARSGIMKFLPSVSDASKQLTSPIKDQTSSNWTDQQVRKLQSELSQLEQRYVWL